MIYFVLYDKFGTTEIVLLSHGVLKEDDLTFACLGSYSPVGGTVWEAVRHVSL